MLLLSVTPRLHLISVDLSGSAGAGPSTRGGFRTAHDPWVVVCFHEIVDGLGRSRAMVMPWVWFL